MYLCSYAVDQASFLAQNENDKILTLKVEVFVLEKRSLCNFLVVATLVHG